MRMLAYDGSEIVAMVQPFWMEKEKKSIISASEKCMLKVNKVSVEVVLPTLKRLVLVAINFLLPLMDIMYI